MAEMHLLLAVLALVAWTLVMWVWMYATRLPTMRAAAIDPQDARHPGALSVLPAGVRQVAENHNHLHEQPVLFYATALAIHAGGWVDGVTVAAAWSYVVLRVAHSLVQATINRVVLRFVLYAAATAALGTMVARAFLVSHGLA
jgi:hypothetical protein